MNGMYNMFTVINLLAAQKKLKANNVEGNQAKLIVPSLLPGIAGNPVSQFLMTDAAVNNAITSKEKDDVEEQKRVVDQNNIQLTTDNEALKGDKAALSDSLIQMVNVSVVLDSTGKGTGAQAEKLIEMAKKYPVFRTLLVNSPALTKGIRDFVVNSTTDSQSLSTTSVGIFADTTSSPDPKKPKLAPTS